MVIRREPLRVRDHSRNVTRDAWLRSKIHDILKLKTPKGALIPLDSIFLENLGMPKGLRHRDKVMLYSNNQLSYLQNRHFTLDVSLNNPAYPQKLKLLNPIITRLDQRHENIPSSSSSRVDSSRYLQSATDSIHLEFEILSDSITHEFPTSSVAVAIKRALKRNSIAAVLGTRQEMLAIQVSVAETKARNTLRDALSEKEFRKYLINGFIMIKGKSGKWYQVFNKQKHIKVYERGKLIKELCIHTEGCCPPTDHVLNMKIMLECDEQTVWDNSNTSNPTILKDFQQENNTNIVNLFGKLKKQEAHRKKLDREFLERYV